MTPHQINKRLNRIGANMPPIPQDCLDCDRKGCEMCNGTGRIEYPYDGDVQEDIKWLYNLAREQQQQLTPGSPTERAPTTWAYEQVCKALEASKQEAIGLEQRRAYGSLIINDMTLELADAEKQVKQLTSRVSELEGLLSKQNSDERME